MSDFILEGFFPRLLSPSLVQNQNSDRRKKTTKRQRTGRKKQELKTKPERYIFYTENFVLSKLPVCFEHFLTIFFH